MIDDSKLEQEMGEAAALPPDDPRRRALEQRLAGDATSTDQQWRDLLLENDGFRDNLATVEVPKDLEDRLLAVAGDQSQPQLRSWTRWSWGLAAAAVLLIVVGVEAVRRYDADARMQTIALLAINNHLNHLEDHGVQAESGDKRTLEAALAEQVGFEVRVPELDDRLQLSGGRKCKLGTHVVAFTLWRDGGGEYSLFQFQPDRFGLPATIQPTLVHSTQPAATEHTCGAWIWTEGSCGYVLTGDPGNDLSRLSPRKLSGE